MNDENPYAAPAELGVEQSPEREPEPSPIASHNERQIAVMLDMAFLVAVFLLTQILLEALHLNSGRRYWLLPLGLSLSFIYLNYCRLEYKTGKSLGKYLARTTVLSRNGGCPTQRQLLVRTLARLIPFDTFSNSVRKDNVVYYRDSLSGTVVVSDKSWHGDCTWL